MNSWSSWRWHPWIALLVRLYLASVFLAACFHKLVHPEVFAVDVATYQLLPQWSINAFALVLPWVELLTGAMLVLGFRVKAASLLIALMMVSFMISLAWALHLHLDMSCGCFASQAATTDDPISWHTIVRDSAWLGMAVYVFLFDRHPLGIDRLSWRFKKVASRTDDTV